MHELLSIRHWAARHGVKFGTAKSWTERGLLPITRISGRIFVHQDARPIHQSRVLSA